jgi:hypothetical protein
MDGGGPVRHWLKLILKTIVYTQLVLLAIPFASGLYYWGCYPHDEEQVYLDKCITHLKAMRAISEDPDIQGVLDYTIARYNHVGPWDVMVFPLLNGFYPEGWKTIGMNCPWCPGMTLDPILFTWPPDETAIVIAHEALHDYKPFFGHEHINAREAKMKNLSRIVWYKEHGYSNAK